MTSGIAPEADPTTTDLTRHRLHQHPAKLLLPVLGGARGQHQNIEGTQGEISNPGHRADPLKRAAGTPGRCPEQAAAKQSVLVHHLQ